MRHEGRKEGSNSMKQRRRSRMSEKNKSMERSKETNKRTRGGKRTTPGIPTWSPTVVLTGPDDA